jgi:ubiquinone/menaquinone biosynthesis C-methylase UbiE
MSKLRRIPGRLIGKVRRWLPSFAPRQTDNRTLTNTDYWTGYNVTGHCRFTSRAQSLDYLHWRNGQYLFYDELMPCSGHDGKVILDYGCGPGHDLAGFLEFSRPRKVVAADISRTSLQEARERVRLHGGEGVDFHLLTDGQAALPFEDNSVDYVHTSGVLHHTPNVEQILREFTRILRPSGMVRVMVYNYHCIWLHLYVAYERRIVQQLDAGLSLEESFKRSTDTEACPISRWYKAQDFLSLCAASGLTGTFRGAAMSVNEMELLPRRYAALTDPALPREHRDFLHGLQFDSYGRPLWQGQVAGLDAVFEFRKAG